jgi:hypothetical protein
MPIENQIRVSATVESSGIQLSRVLADDAVVDKGNLEDEFCRLPELLAWWLTAIELQREVVNTLKFDCDRLMAVVDYNTRQEAKNTNDVMLEQAQAANLKAKDMPSLIKLTEKMVENTVLTHPDVKVAKDALLIASKNLGLLEAGKTALLAKKDMLVSLGANYRAEGAMNPVILQDAMKERIRREQQKKYPEAHTKKPVGKK